MEIKKMQSKLELELELELEHEDTGNWMKLNGLFDELWNNYRNHRVIIKKKRKRERE